MARIASGRVNAAFCLSIQTSRAASWDGCKRTPMRVPLTAERFHRGVVLSLLDLIMALCYHKSKPRESVNFHPGSNPSHEGPSNPMTQADSITNTRRRDFLALTAAAATAVMAARPALATMTNDCNCIMCLAEGDNSPHRLRATELPEQSRTIASPLDDSALLALEEQIFEQYWAATAYDDEIIRLSEIWTAESKRLYAASFDAEGNSSLTPQQRWDIVTALPESIEHNRLCRLQDPFYARMDALIKQMFATPAHTAEGRRAKATVLLGCVMGDEWRRVDAETDYPELMVRNLLIEFVGGEPGAQLRDQFVSGKCA